MTNISDQVYLQIFYFNIKRTGLMSLRSLSPEMINAISDRRTADISAADVIFCGNIASIRLSTKNYAINVTIPV